MTAVIRDGELSTPPDPSGWIAELGKLAPDETTQQTLTILDDMLTTGGSTDYVSNSLLNGIMGAFDQIALVVTTCRAYVVSPGDTITLTVDEQHSSDGRFWVNKAASVFSITVSQTGTSGALYLDDGTIPHLAFVRFRFNLASSGFACEARVTATVTCNNTRERAFATKFDAAALGCVASIPGGTRFYVDDGDVSEPRLAAVLGTVGDGLYVSGSGNSTIVEGQSAWRNYFKPVSGYVTHYVGVHGTYFTGWMELLPQFQLCFRSDGSMLVLQGGVTMATYHAPDN